MLTFVIAGLITAAGYAFSLYRWPFRPCGRCDGTGRNQGSNKRRYGQCRRCDGTGRRIRLGAKTLHRGRVALADRARRRKGSK